MLLAQVLPEGRVFGLDSQTVISIGIQLFNGIFLAVVLRLILYKPVKEFMRKRSEGIQQKMNEADATMVKAQELISQYELKINEIEKERTEILEIARLKSIDEGKLILEDARREASEIKKRSSESVLADKKRLQEETRFHIIELASLIAEKYITLNMDDKTQDTIFEETLAQMEATPWQS
jgi:F-type H+-transporting ATPase subunit b